MWPVCWRYNEPVFDSFDMQPEKNHHDLPKILFLKDGKLTTELKDLKLRGEIKILDSTSLACITGSFQKGFCHNAEVITLNPVVISNILVEIKSDGEVWMGGCAVQESNFEGFVYEGGYQGYRRWGYGRTEETVSKRLYDQHCQWEGHQQISNIIKEYQNCSNKVTSIIFIEKIQENRWIETTVKETEGRYIKKVENSQGIKEQRQISFQQYQKEIENGLVNKQILKEFNKKVEFMAPIKNSQLKWNRYDEHGLQNAQKYRLSYELCQVYLQHLLCQQQTHTTKPTAVLSINIADLLYQKMNKDNVDERLKWYMQSFKKPFDLFGGFWKRIIVPLVLTNVNKHFSFVMIELDPIRCTYFDSASFQHAKLYEQLIKDLINSQKGTQGQNGDYCHEEKISFTLYLDFPLQSDNFSCGYFMLQGIQEMINYDKVVFQTKDLPKIREKILGKLRSLL